jgi:hypothetical protein
MDEHDLDTNANFDRRYDEYIHSDESREYYRQGPIFIHTTDCAWRIDLTLCTNIELMRHHWNDITDNENAEAMNTLVRQFRAALYHVFDVDDCFECVQSQEHWATGQFSESKNYNACFGTLNDFIDAPNIVRVQAEILIEWAFSEAVKNLRKILKSRATK